MMNQDWNPHVDHQAIDRAHRIGQQRKARGLRSRGVKSLASATNAKYTTGRLQGVFGYQL